MNKRNNPKTAFSFFDKIKSINSCKSNKIRRKTFQRQQEAAPEKNNIRFRNPLG